MAGFPTPTLEQWRDEVVRLLKGAPYDKKMLSPTWEGITLQPMYTREDTAELDLPRVLPGDSPYLRAAEPLGTALAGWQVAQELPYPTYEAFNEALRFDLERGQNAVNLMLDRATQAGLDPDQARVGEVGLGGTSIASLVGLGKALDGVDLAATPIYVQPGSAALPFAALLVALMRRRSQDVASSRGSIGMDPLVRPRRARVAAGVDRAGLRGAGAAHRLGGARTRPASGRSRRTRSRTTTPAGTRCTSWPSRWPRRWSTCASSSAAASASRRWRRASCSASRSARTSSWRSRSCAPPACCGPGSSRRCGGT